MPLSAYEQAAIDGELAKLAGCNSRQEETMNAAGLALAGMVKGWELDEHEIKTLFLAACRTLPDLPSAKGKWTLRHFTDKWFDVMRDATPRTKPNGLNGNGHAGPHKIAPPKRKPQIKDVALPNWTPPTDGFPKFESIGKSDPAKVPGEIRRHVYIRDGQSIHAKIKYKRDDGSQSWLSYYRVQNKGGRIGWQARKPGGYVDAPYVPPGPISPFDPELADQPLHWCEGEKDADTLARFDLCAISFGSSSTIIAPFDEIKNRHIVIFGDNDEAGRKFAADQAKAIIDHVASVKTYTFPDLPPGGDVSDYVTEHGGYKLLEIIAALKPIDPLDDAIESGQIFIAQIGGQIMPREDTQWLIHKALPAKGFGIVYGAPKSGKTFLIADAMFHIAAGIPWHGRELTQGAICYIAAEGQHRFGDRVHAMFEHYEIKDAPFILIPVAPKLGDEKGDADKIIATIKAALASWHRRTGQDAILRAIVVDTMAKSMRGKDENAVKDVSMFIDNCIKIAAPFDCLSIAVHHSGKDEDRGMRGSSSIEGDSDFIWHVKKSEGLARHVEIEAMKDGPEGEEWSFILQKHEWKNTQFESLEPSCVVEMVAGGEHRGEHKQRKAPSDMERPLLDIIRNAILAEEGFFVGDPNVPENVKSVSRELAKKYAISGGWLDEGGKNPRQHFNNYLTKLSGKGYIGMSEARIWLL